MVNIQKYGYALIREAVLDEISATLYELEHIKTGARLIYLDRPDENKTFAIGFPTPPDDDTGVFHIIEHSVLCGSKKYPLNDPFAELLKGSLNTFLNAVTYEDRTVYPVSSRCEKDFLNLVDVYLDAVFAPNMLDNPAIFMQEGWHYDYDAENDSLSYNGVVYNEMKGAYSSADEIGMMALNSALYRGTPYCRDSGGNPLHIPALSYEAFKSAHKKYYHPSSAKIILDGEMDLGAILPIISSHLDSFEKRECPAINYGIAEAPVENTEISYELAEGEEESGRTRIMHGYVSGGYTAREDNLAISVLCDLLCGSNAAPLKKAILDSGLAKDAAMYTSKSRENTLVIEIRDADESRLDEIDRIINRVVSEQVTGGIDKSKIIAVMNSMEFKLRERDFGSLPAGIAYAMSIYGVWMYGARPEDALLLNDMLANVKAKIDTDYFEKLLSSTILNNARHARVVMHPDNQLGAKNAEAERLALDGILNAMEADELERVIRGQTMMLEWQNAKPTEEALATIPALTLTDLPDKISRPAAEVKEIDGVKTLLCPINADGIVYASIFLDASDLRKKELIELSMLSAALLNFPTENYDALSLQNEIKANLGRLFTSFTVGVKNDVVTPYLKISASALISKRDDLVRLVRELLHSKIDDVSEIKNLVAQTKSHLEDAIISSGESVAILRVEASMSDAGTTAEYLSGYEAYKILCNINGDDEKISALTDRIRALLTRLTDRRRLLLSVNGDVDERFIRDLIDLMPEGSDSIVRAELSPCADKSEYLLIPSKVAYAALGGKTARAAKNVGLMRVVRSILSYEYLWNRVRVQGGAYGTGFSASKNGVVFFHSYRDPSPAASLTAFRESVDYLRALADERADVTKFVIGAIGELDSIITPRTASVICDMDYMYGWTPDDEARIRHQIRETSYEDLYLAADIIEEAIGDESIAIVGGADQLSTLGFTPGSVLKI